MDTEAIQKICDKYMAYLESDDYSEDNHWDSHVFETTMRAVFGADIWERIRGIHRERRIRELLKESDRIRVEIERLG